MSSPSSNTEEGEAWLLQVESRGEEFAEIVMEEDEGDSLEVHPPALRGALWLASPLFEILLKQ